MRLGCSAALALLLLASPCVEALEVPPLTGRVVDLAGVIPEDLESSLVQRLADLEVSDSTQVVVLTVKSLEGEPIEAYSIRVADAWRIGHRGSDNGVILLVALQEREVRIEVGYGLEGRLPDITAGKIIRNDIVPRFRSGDHAGGIAQGVESIVASVKGEYRGTGQPTGSLSRESPGTGLLIFAAFTLLLSAAGAAFRRVLGGGLAMAAWLIGGFIFLGTAAWLLILLFAPILFGAGMISPEILRLLASGSRGSSGWSSGGGGGFSGGGGGFGGGGASGKW